MGGGGGAAGTLAVTNKYLYKIHADLLSGGVDAWDTTEEPVDTASRSFIDIVNSLVTGPHDICVNGNFTYGDAYWSLTAGWAVVDNRLVHTPGDSGAASQGAAINGMAEGATYSISFVISDYVAGQIQVKFGSTVIGVITSSGAHYLQGICGDNAMLMFLPNSAFDGKIDNISLYAWMGNPYLDINAYVPADIGNIAANAEAYKGDVDSIIPVDEWDTLADNIVDKIEDIIPDRDTDSIISNAVTKATSVVADMLSNFITDTIPKGEQIADNVQAKSSEYITTVVNAAVTVIISKVTAMFTQANSEVSSLVATEISTALSETEHVLLALTIDPEALFATALNSIKDKLPNVSTEAMSAASTALLAVKINVESIFTTAASRVDNTIRGMIAEAVVAATSSVNSNVIKDLVDAYEVRRTSAFMRSVNRLSSSMADINAVNSSTFTMGMALLESDFQSDLNKFDAETVERLHETVLGKFIDSYITTLGAYLRAELENAGLGSQAYGSMMSKYLEAFIGALGIYTGLQTKKADIGTTVYRDILSNRLNSFSTVLGNYMRSQLETLATYIGTHADYVRGHTGVVKDLMASQAEMFRAVLSQYSNIQAETDLQIDRLRTAIISAGTDQLTRILMQKLGLKANYYPMNENYYKLKMALEKEEYDRNIELNYLESTWDLSLFQTAGGLLSAVAGGSTYIPNKPSLGSNVAGGAISGIATGAYIGTMAAPGVGTAIGAGIGGLLGGLGGGFANQ